jgi:hypothetical protein
LRVIGGLRVSGRKNRTGVGVPLSHSGKGQEEGQG